MKKQHQPLMIAYMVFLFICMIYHLISRMFKFDFPAWEHIIASATIASYFFSLSSAQKSGGRTADLHIDFLTTLELSYYEMCAKIRKHSNETNENEENNKLASEIETTIDRILDEKKKTKIEKQKYHKRALVLDIIGFVMFFVVWAFDPLYLFVEGVQEGTTLMAFLMVLAAEYFEGWYIENYNEAKASLIKIDR